MSLCEHVVQLQSIKGTSFPTLGISSVWLCVTEWALMMKICILGLLVLGCVYGAPVEEGLKPESCDDPHAVKAAHVALSKINMERNEGYIFSLHRLSNVHHAKHVSRLNKTEQFFMFDTLMVFLICAKTPKSIKNIFILMLQSRLSGDFKNN